MPTHESIVNTVLPQAVEKPIPTRTVITRSSIKQPTTHEVKPAAEQATPEESVRLSPQLSALARKEQAYRQREQALKEREKALEAKLSEAEQYSQLKEKIGSKDYSAAEALGLTYEEYTKYLLEKEAGEDPQALKFKSLEEQIQALKKGEEEKATREYEETVAAYKTEIAKVIESNPEFQKIKKAKKEDAVLRLILDTFEEDGSELTIEQASKDVEMFLTEQAKLWAALNEEPESSPGVPVRVLPPPRPGSVTLTQQMQPPSGERRPAKSLQHLSESERYAEARRRALERRQQGG